MQNLLQIVENKRFEKVFSNGLNRYTQANCQVTATDEGIRIYRPPNIDVSAHNMWGGLRIQPYYMENKDVLQKGHTYIIKFHVKGKSTYKNAYTAHDGIWTNNMGWNGSTNGLMPTPSDVSYDFLPDNFEGEKECFYKWTINDDVYKVCTVSYSNFVAGETYLSYRDFPFQWNYQNTGEMGTDVYITNIRMYDLTNGGENISIKKTGICCCDCYENNNTNLKIYKDGEIISNSFIEL